MLILVCYYLSADREAKYDQKRKKGQIGNENADQERNLVPDLKKFIADDFSLLPRKENSFLTYEP